MIPSSLVVLELEGRLVTGDAIFCQRDFCQQVIDAKGDYLVFVKDNQPSGVTSPQSFSGR